MPPETPQSFFVPDCSLLKAPHTASEVARELGRSVTAIKALARQIHAPVLKTESGIWLFTPPAVEKVRAEIQRREMESLRR